MNERQKDVRRRFKKIGAHPARDWLSAKALLLLASVFTVAAVGARIAPNFQAGTSM